MPFFTLNGVTIPIKSNAVTVKHNENGLDRDRMFDGTMRVFRRGQIAKYGAGVYREWDVNTASMSDADVAVLLGMVNGDTLPLALSGDIVGGDTVAVIPVPGTNNPLQTSSGFRRLNAFTLHETPAPLPPDTSAEPYLAWIADLGEFQNQAGTVAAGDGDKVEHWNDQSGNGHAHVNQTVIGGVCCVPTRVSATHSLRMGESALVGGGPGTGVSYLIVPDDPPGSFAAFPSVELMVEFIVDAYPPATDAVGGLLNNTRFGADGHLYCGFGVDSFQYDCGIPIVDPSAAYTNLSIASGPSEFTVRLNNAVQFTSAPPAHAYHVPVVTTAVGVADPSVNSERMVGNVRHVAMFSGFLTTTQRRSWYDFMRGAIADPPLP